MDQNNIESRLKDVMLQIKDEMKKDYDELLAENIRKSKEEVINNLLNMFPHLEKKKKEIIAECIKDKELDDKINNDKPKKPVKVDEMVFDVIQYKNKNYFLNDNKGIWDDNAELIGTLLGYDDKNEPIISFYDTDNNSKLSENIHDYIQ